MTLLLHCSFQCTICFALLILLDLALNVYCYHHHSPMFGIRNSILSETCMYSNAASNNKKRMMTLDEVNEYASLCGVTIVPTITGPLLRLEAFISLPQQSSSQPSQPSSSQPSSSPQASPSPSLIGYLTAIIRPIPFGLLQLDTIQVKNRRQTLGFQREGWSIDGPGISFIMGSYALIWAYNNGCRRTELLAVKDTDKMHNILVRLYESFGFKVLREVGDSAASIPDRLAWGAVGSLMVLDLDTFFTQWSPKLRLYIELAKRKVVATTTVITSD